MDYRILIIECLSSATKVLIAEGIFSGDTRVVQLVDTTVNLSVPPDHSTARHIMDMVKRAGRDALAVIVYGVSSAFTCVNDECLVTDGAHEPESIRTVVGLLSTQLGAISGSEGAWRQ